MCKGSHRHIEKISLPHSHCGTCDVGFDSGINPAGPSGLENGTGGPGWSGYAMRDTDLPVIKIFVEWTGYISICVGLPYSFVL